MTGKIITVTPHTAIDLHVTVAEWRLGETLNANQANQSPAGKGLNVARTLACLGQPVHAIAWVGAESLAFFDSLQGINLKGDYLPVAGKTRTNITLFDSKTQQETHLRTPGFAVTEADCDQLRQHLSACVKANDLVILSGSLPTAAPVDLYRQLITLCQQAGAKVFLDSSGDSLKHGLMATPFLIKPNQHEFEQLVGKSLKNKQTIVCAARAMIANGVTWVIISQAEQGAIFVSHDLAFEASVALKNETIIRHVGCGDTLLAGFALAIFRGEKEVDCIKTALACGTANLFATEAGEIEPARVEAIKASVIIHPL